MGFKSRVLTVLLGLVCVLTLLWGTAFANTSYAIDTKKTLLPDDAYYWMKCIEEQFCLRVYANTEAEAGWRLKSAEERLNEALEMEAQNRLEEAKSALARYRAQIEFVFRSLERVIMEAQNRLEEAKSALARYRAQIEFVFRSLERVIKLARAQSGAQTVLNEKNPSEKIALKNGWFESNEMLERIEQRLRLQLELLNRLLELLNRLQNRAEERILNQLRLTIEICIFAANQERARECATRRESNGTLEESNGARGTSGTPAQNNREREQARTEAQNENYVQTQTQNRDQNCEQNRQSENEVGQKHGEDGQNEHRGEENGNRDDSPNGNMETDSSRQRDPNSQDIGNPGEVKAKKPF